jgi:hypothetical protein
MTFGHFMAFSLSRKANPSSQKQKLVTDNFSGTLVNSHHANPKIRPVICSHKNTALHIPEIIKYSSGH